MNTVTLITNDIDLYNVFSNSKLFDEVNIASSLDEKIEYDYLVVSDRLYNINELIQSVERGIRAKKITYLLSSAKGNQSGYSSLTALLKSHGISILPPKLTESQLLLRFCEIINLQERKTNNVVVLFGADSKVGTTLTALSIAENMAEQSEGNIAFLNMSGHLSYSYVENCEGKGMDSIRSKVFNKILSKDELMESMVKSRELKNLYILPPCKTLIDFKYYKTDHIEYVINMASKIFDAVIVDAGWYPHNELYFGALNSTPNRYMVTTPQQSNLDNHRIIKQQALDEYGITERKSNAEKRDTPNNILLIVNKQSDGLGTNVTKDYDMVFAVSLPYIPNASYLTDIQNKSLRGLRKQYDRQLDKLTNVMALQIEYKLQQKQKAKSIFNRG
ncbi:hypothetical protein [Clostridium sp. BNL1100]|uniref:hypothetical protein n=1 Tax=Clostridium sp. BNL1100 TaxID=755731 RepID=UPI00024A77D0|nr:hypothetical protein [Clostridium sp. BNL1100]AEY65621.1 hypothetical protein Clo1100_1386 [Clostridium sp. BNL1100]